MNSRPLICCLEQFVSGARIIVDVPSRLADELAAGRLDVGLIPSIEYFRQPGCTIVSNACVACEGPVKSVMLYSRVAFRQIRTLALDEGSRTSAALVRILLKEQFGLEPELAPLPIGSTAQDTPADAVLLIGDRGIVGPEGRFHSIWDLGQQWRIFAGLPFVFSMWVARPGLDHHALDAAFSLARDAGVCRIDSLAREEGARLGIGEDACRAYLRDHLRFRLGPRERQGLESFCRLAAVHGFIPKGAQLVFADSKRS